MMRDVARDPVQHASVARERVRDLAKVERKALPAQQGDAGAVAIFPGEIDSEEPHAVGTAMLPARTVTAEPPTLTRVTAPA